MSAGARSDRPQPRGSWRQAEASRQLQQQGRPDRALPIIFDVGQPGAGLHHRQAVTGGRNGEVHAVRRSAERHLLGRGRRGLRRCRCDRRRSGGLFGGLVAHLADEADAAAGERADEFLLLAAVADRAPRRVDPLGHGRVRDDPTVPDCRQQIILADHAIPVADHVQQQVEHLRLDRHQVAAAAQLAPIRIEGAIAEQEAHSPVFPTLAAGTLAPPAQQKGGFLKEK